MTTMNERWDDGSEHISCIACGMCIECGDCKKYGCGNNISVKITEEKDNDNIR